MIFYFSGTGNSLSVAKKLGSALQEEVVNVLHFRNETEVVCNDEVIGFVYPVYGSDSPRVFKEFLLKLKVPANSYCFAVGTMNKMDQHSFEYIDQALVNCGAKLSFAENFLMPGNCIPTEGLSEGWRLGTEAERAMMTAGKIKTRTVNFTSPGKKTGPDFVQAAFGGSEAHKGFLTFIIKDSCTGCGLCARMCPTKNICIENGKAVHGSDCIACFSCFHWCPEKAVAFNSGMEVLDKRGQYTHPDVTADMIIDGNWK